MKTVRWFRIGVLMLVCWLGGGVVSVWPQEMAVRLERERKNDDQMYQLMRQMLVDFGYSNKVAALGTMWQKTSTPQQWAEAKRVKQAEPDRVPVETERILARLPLRPTVGFSQFFTDVCAQGQDLREIVRVLVAWTARGGQAELQARGDWTMHFIYGAACELNLGLGYFAAVMKEHLDQQRGGPFDFGDMAASMAGAEWVHQVERNPQWLAEWQTGRRTLANNLPALRYGTGVYSMQIAERVHADILVAYGIRSGTPQTERVLETALRHQ
ncbi:MAG: hypothetical protein WCG79_00480 [Verrucomicrobiota bacterium]|jgi:hypothetical protein